MPLMRTGAQLIYYAHVPKCAGSSVEDYLAARFGPLAFCDTAYLRQAHPWSRTSPQHIDRTAFARLFPADFIDASFAVVRHPVARIVSAWHFQLEVEKTVPAGVSFSDWLADLPERWEETPYIYDNHTRPMDDIVPEDSEVFHLEHGLDAIIAWFDRLTGNMAGPRFIGEVNARGGHAKTKSAKVTPGSQDLQMIAELYQRDFDRFGYRINDKMPLAAPPVASAAEAAERQAARVQASRPGRRLLEKFRKR